MWFVENDGPKTQFSGRMKKQQFYYGISQVNSVMPYGTPKLLLLLLLPPSPGSAPVAVKSAPNRRALEGPH